MQLFTMIRFVFIFLIAPLCYSQSFAPAPGIVGSTAIYKDSSIITGWATSVDITRGWLDIANKPLGVAGLGQDSDALGYPDGMAVVTLGDSGVATLQFDYFISNGPGPDFAVFENGFTDDYMEFAFVEVSSDGNHFVRFPSVSETPTNTQIDNFSFSDCRYVHNLAGKYRAEFGTPFDLEDLVDSTNIDLNAISHVRLIDVVGSINPQYGTYDSQGNIINDPYPTAFEGGGFDLDAVAVINGYLGITELKNEEVIVYPNPASESITISGTNEEVRILDVSGRVIWKGRDNQVDVSSFNSGIYFVYLTKDNFNSVTKFEKR